MAPAACSAGGLEARAHQGGQRGQLLQTGAAAELSTKAHGLGGRYRGFLKGFGVDIRQV